MSTPAPSSPSHALPWRAGAAYGLMGFPLAFAALPLYVVLPNHYVRHFGLSLATVGLLLMVVRLLDAVIEPWLGRASDTLYAQGTRMVLWVAIGTAVLHWLGMGALFFPAVQEQTALSIWLVAGLLVTCMAHSLLLIAHQTWGVQLGGDELLRSRVVAWREGLGLAGVMTASALSVGEGSASMLGALAAALLLGCLGWWRAPQPVALPARQARPEAAVLWLPLMQPAFRRLLAVFMCNGIASAIPAALMLFFAQDRLQSTDPQTAVFLVLYFVSAAASMPLWLKLVRRWGLVWSWWWGMLLAVVCFIGTAGLQANQQQAFAVICALTGVALGADLVMPGAMLAQLIERQGAQGSQDGAYLGWWSLATKLNLALAAGAALPALQWLGYVPGSQDPVALQHLAWAYALLPCLLKLLAAVLLYLLLMRTPSFFSAQTRSFR